jgi:hypothetical protein
VYEIAGLTKQLQGRFEDKTVKEKLNKREHDHEKCGRD